MAKAVTPVRYLALAPYDFWESVIGELGVPTAEALALRQPFLRQLRFCQNWHPQAIMRFAQLSTLVNCNAGDQLISERQDTANLFIVYEGTMLVRQRKRARARLRRGSFFGKSPSCRTVPPPPTWSPTRSRAASRSTASSSCVS